MDYSALDRRNRAKLLSWRAPAGYLCCAPATGYCRLLESERVFESKARFIAEEE